MPTPKSTTPQPNVSSLLPAKPQTVLIAVTGLSPAVLAETIWALANQPGDPMIPDKVIVLTTLTGERKIKEQLFGPDDLWLTLRQQILGENHESDERLDFADTPDRIRVFTRRSGGRRIPLDRMDTIEETEAVGDGLVEEIWNWVGRPDTRVLASISGGFKTMSALLYAAMTVLGSPQDRILHVLVEEPFDGGTTPLFFWPGQPVQELKSTRPSRLGPADTAINAAQAQLVLTEVQFPPLRELFGNYGFKEPPTFGSLVSMSRKAVASLAPPSVTSLVLRPGSLTVEVNGLPLDVSKLEFYMLSFLIHCAMENLHFDVAGDCSDAYQVFLSTEYQRAPIQRQAYLKERLTALKDDDGSRLTKTLSALRRKLENSGIVGIALAKHLPKGKHTLTLPVELITIE